MGAIRNGLIGLKAHSSLLQVRGSTASLSAIGRVGPTMLNNAQHRGQVPTAVIWGSYHPLSLRMTDDAATYYKKLKHFREHGVVNHSAGEYVRDDIHTNTVESYFLLFKRGMRGVCQRCDERHLHRYLAEFDFRYNARVALGVNDEQRAAKMVKGVKGKRLTYKAADRRVSGNAEAQGT
jgi:hypothetical protein